MNNIEKPNDIFVATLSNPNATSLDLLQNNINVNNTALLSRDQYKNTPLAKKVFTTEDGSFNEDAFNKAYDIAEQKYF
ncbi:MAG: hypothetical protein Q4C49_00535 [Bacillota bacterium]|nr:hypothetical protein [Bacillota bacterium]